MLTPLHPVSRACLIGAVLLNLDCELLPLGYLPATRVRGIIGPTLGNREKMCNRCNRKERDLPG
jgi:hypothetical protein